MTAGSFDDILKHDGYQRIGTLTHRLHVSLWWHGEHRTQVLLCVLGSTALLRGSKSYWMRTISPEGETYARDIPQLHQYLESHFDEVRIAFSHFRDATAAAGRDHIQRRRDATHVHSAIPTPDDLAALQGSISRSSRVVEAYDAFEQLTTNPDDLLSQHIDRVRRAEEQAVDHLRHRHDRIADQVAMHETLQRQYAAKGAAATLSFSVTSNTQLASSPGELRDALHSAQKELADLDRFQVRQKLNGGRLQVHVVEATSPEINWIEEWMGGALSPVDIDRISHSSRGLASSSAERVMVCPKEDIKVDGRLKEPSKLLPAKIASTMLSRLDSSRNSSDQKRSFTAADRPVNLGRLWDGDQLTEPVQLPLTMARHIYVSGTTGCGKSYLGRVLVEEAAQYKDLGILVMDPRNQWAGILTAEDRDSIHAHYADFRMKPEEARGFDFTYHCPGQKLGAELPPTLGDLGRGRRVLSFKALDDNERCTLFADVLDAAFESIAGGEAERPQLLIVIEEAHRFTRKRVDASAKEAATRAEITLDRVVREGRKFGCCVVILSQTIRDFGYDAASIRQNTNTKVFMQNSDREIEYASDFIEDAKRIIQLPPAAAVMHNPTLGECTLRIRPPYSMVWEFGPDETANLLEPTRPTASLTVAARELLGVLTAYSIEHGNGPKVGQLSELSGISSKRKLHALLSQLEEAHVVRSTYLRERGKPRIVEPVHSTSLDEMAEESGENTQANGRIA